MNITRSDRSKLALWWWTVDRYLLSSFFVLMMFGIFLVMASSQHLAENLNIPSHFFTVRHLFFGLLSIPIIIFSVGIINMEENFNSLISILFGILLIVFAINPWASGLCLKLSLENN